MLKKNKKEKVRNVGFKKKWKLGGGEGNGNAEERQTRVGRREGHMR